MFLIFYIFGILVLGLPSVQADSWDNQSPETEATHEIKSDEAMAEVETGGSVEGMVKRVDLASGVLVVRDTDEDAKVYNLTVKKTTTYAGISSLSDINPGDSITVDCYGLEGHLIAETITLQDRAYQKEKPEKLEKVLVD